MSAVLIGLAVILVIEQVGQYLLMRQIIRKHLEARYEMLRLIETLSRELEKHGHSYPNKDGKTMREWALGMKAHTEGLLAKKLI